MKAVFLVYNQAITEEVQEMLDRLRVRGFTQWENVKGRGTHSGEPHMGTHTWPAMNSSVLAVTDEHKAKQLLKQVQELNAEFGEQGIRAFTWNIEESV